MIRFAVLCTGIVLAGAAAPLGAQPVQGALPPLGARIRVETRGGSRVVGTVQSIEADTMRIYGGRRYSPALPIHVLPLADIRGYAVSLGRDRWRGARNGAFVGGGLGLVLVAFAAHTDATSHSDTMIPGTFFAVPAAVVLTGIGALIGAAAAPDRWSAPVALQLVPGSDESLGIGLRLRF